MRHTEMRGVQYTCQHIVQHLCQAFGGDHMVRTNDNRTDRPSVKPGLQAGLSTQVTNHRNSRRGVTTRPRQLCFRHHLNKSYAQMR